MYVFPANFRVLNSFLIAFLTVAQIFKSYKFNFYAKL